MSAIYCPYCQALLPVGPYTVQKRFPAFNSDYDPYYNSPNSCSESTLCLTFYHCTNCSEYSIAIEGIGRGVKDIDTFVRPASLAKQFPDYIPEAIRKDYEEAYSIVNLSPKASATLARRCLQGMICDFWQIRENNLAKSIEKLKDKIPASQWKVIDAIRRIGNIGAHMEKDINLIIDIEPDEAMKLLSLIELLLKQWYIDRYEQEKLYSDIAAIDTDKQERRKKTE